MIYRDGSNPHFTETKNYFKCSRNPKTSIFRECVTSPFVLIYCDLLSAELGVSVLCWLKDNFNSDGFHAISPHTSLSLVLPPNHFYFPRKLMEHLKCEGQRKMKYVTSPFLL